MPPILARIVQLSGIIDGNVGWPLQFGLAVPEPPGGSLPKGLSYAGAGIAVLAIVLGISFLFLGCLRHVSKRTSSLGRIAQLSLSEIRILIPATILLFLSSALTLLIPYFGGEFIKTLTSQGSVETSAVNKTMAQVLIAGVLASVCSSARGYLYTLAGERVINRLRQRIFRALLRQEMAYFDAETSGQLISRLTNDAGALQNAATSDISMALRSLASCLMTLAILFWTSWKLTLSMLAVIPICSFMAAFMGRLSRKNGKAYQEHLSQVGMIAGETLSNMRTVRAFHTGELLMLKRFCNASDATYQAGRTKAIIYGSWAGVVGMLFYIAFSVVLWFGAKLVQEGDMEVGALVSFILYTISLSASIAMLGSVVPRFSGVLGATAKIFEILEREPKLLEGRLDPGPECSGLVEFEDVTFSYPTRPDVKVLDGVSFVAKPNQVVALVGPSGSGKSSIVSLLQRLYDCQSGSVRVDHYDVRELATAYLRRHIAVVSQEPILFATTIRENIRFGVSGDISDDDMQVSAQLANCHDFVTRFPAKYETEVGERGVQLSGGQKQRVAIARALMANPTILLLDEATSALDSESEGIVQEAMNKLMAQRAGRTHIVVAHRLSTIRSADLIVVLKNGMIAEMGKHDALVANAGVYRELQRRQLAKDGDFDSTLAIPGPPQGRPLEQSKRQSLSFS